MSDEDATKVLWELVDARTKPGADREAIDREIWERYGHECAIVFTDLSGFSRQVAAFGIIHFLQIILQQNRLLLPAAEAHRGRLIKIEADSLLITYPTARDAVMSVIDMQHACAAFNVGRPAEESVLLCVGVGFGRVLRIGTTDVFGQEVNAASKLGEDTAKAGEILVTSAVQAACGDLRWEEIAAVPGSEKNFRLIYE
jgi:adenylate cyclase